MINIYRINRLKKLENVKLDCSKFLVSPEPEAVSRRPADIV